MNERKTEGREGGIDIGIEINIGTLIKSDIMNSGRCIREGKDPIQHRNESERSRLQRTHTDRSFCERHKGCKRPFLL